jgi:hypothetical protein
MIIRLLESVKLPSGINLPTGEEWGHYIRPRAIYFDNNNASFIVFADYLYPRGKDVVAPRDINLAVENRVDLDDQRVVYSYLLGYSLRWHIRRKS